MLKFIIIICLSFLNIFTATAQTKVGFADADVTPTSNVPLGGYGSFSRRNWPFRFYQHRPFIRLFRPGLGFLDPIRVKVMTISKNDQRLVFISLDVVGAPAELHETLTNKLSQYGVQREHLYISATHTHSGPGALSKNKFWQAFAMDRFQKDYFEFFINQVVESVDAAIRSEEDAKLISHRFQTEGLTHSRRKANRLIDKEVVTLLAKGIDGRWLGGIINFAIHGVCLSDENNYFSSDVPGAIERKSEEFLESLNKNTIGQKPIVLFINGAEGDVSPDHSGVEGKEKVAEEFVKQFSSNWNDQTDILPDWKINESKVSLGTPRILLERCIENKWIPKGFDIRVKKYINSKTTISQIKMGNLLMATWPGEPTSTLGINLKQLAHNNGYSPVMIMGLTNDHLAYFTTPEEFAEGGYETCVNFFGASGGQIILDNHKELLNK